MLTRTNVRYADVIAEQKANKFEEFEEQLARLKRWDTIRLVGVGMLLGSGLTVLAWWLT